MHYKETVTQMVRDAVRLRLVVESIVAFFLLLLLFGLRVHLHAILETFYLLRYNFKFDVWPVDSKLTNKTFALLQDIHQKSERVDLHRHLRWLSTNDASCFAQVGLFSTSWPHFFLDFDPFFLKTSGGLRSIVPNTPLLEKRSKTHASLESGVNPRKKNKV